MITFYTSVYTKHVRDNPLGGRAWHAHPFSRHFLTTFACTLYTMGEARNINDASVHAHARIRVSGTLRSSAFNLEVVEIPRYNCLREDRLSLGQHVAFAVAA